MLSRLPHLPGPLAEQQAVWATLKKYGLYILNSSWLGATCTVCPHLRMVQALKLKVMENEEKELTHQCTWFSCNVLLISANCKIFFIDTFFNRSSLI